MHLIDTEPITLWLANNIPARLVWRGRRWVVIDTPTALPREPEYLPPMITHPPTLRPGWRFTARDEDGDTRIVDVREHGDGWTVVASYE